MNSRYSPGFNLLVNCLLVFSLLFPQSGRSQNLPGSGNSLLFNGSAYVNGGTSNRTITNQVTAEAWIKTTNSSGYQWVVGKYLDGFSEDKGFQLIMLNGFIYCCGRIHVGRYLLSGASTTRVDDGRWHHVAGTSDGNVWRIYVDGVLENSATYGYTQADFTSSVALTVGNYLAQNGQYFQGDIDEVRVWRTVRTAAEIQQNMCCKFAIAPADLVAYYRFDQNSGVTAIDAGSQPINGTLMGTANAPWHLSGAPLGDASASLYTASTLPASARLGVATSSGDSAVVSGISAAGRGVQVYAVNSPPSIAAGSGASSSYVGVFTTAGAASATYTLRLRPASATTCFSTQQRLSNDLTWSGLPASASTATSQVYGLLTYRGEYIVLVGVTVVPVAITGDSAVCTGATGQLTAAASGAIAYRWSTGATTATISGLAPGTYSVAATFAGGCLGTAQATVRLARAYVPVISGDSVLCSAATTVLQATAPGPATYRWNTGATTTTLPVSQQGTYTVTATSPAGCTRQASFHVRVGLATPAFSLGTDTTLCEGSTLTLHGPAGTGLRYQWSDGSTDRFLTVNTTGSYSLRVLGGCITTQATRTITVRPCLTMPNIITPNNDLHNDLFVVHGLVGNDWNLDVYDRWGRAVLHTGSYHNDWGVDAAPGIYYILLRRNNAGDSYKGWVEVVR